MYTKVYAVGVGMTNFVKPNDTKDYPDIGKEAVVKALTDAGISYDIVQQAVCGYVYGDSTCGQRVLYQVGMTGIPIHNINNHGATGATALFLAQQLVQGGSADVALALGFEKMSTGSLPTTAFPDRTYPLDKHIKKMLEMVSIERAPMAVQCFGNAAIEHMNKYGTTAMQFAKIAAKNHKNGVRNPHALNRKEYSIRDILNSKRVFDPLTKLQCCANSDGAAAVILMSERAVAHHKLQLKAVEILGMAMATDTQAVFSEKSRLKVAGYDMTALAAERVYRKTGVSPDQIDVVELHDCFSSNELITYESLQLCEEGKGGQFVDSGDNTYGGKVVVNPSGGLIAKGNPIGATGVAQAVELVWQLRGEAGLRQVQNAKIGLQHNLGLGGAVVVAIYRKGFNNHHQNDNLSHNPKEFKVYNCLKNLEEAMRNNVENLGDIRGIYGIKVNGLNGAEGYWVVNINEGKAKITYKGDERPDVTFVGSDDLIADIISGKLDPQISSIQTKVEIRGDVPLAQKLCRFASDKMKSRAKL